MREAAAKTARSRGGAATSCCGDARRRDRPRAPRRDPRARGARSSTAARGARPSWASARGARCPTACRWRGWPGSTGTGRCSWPHGEGCRFTDVDGNSYVDFNQADLSATCGFAPPAVLEAIAQRAARGLQFLLPVEEAIEAAELLAERYGLPAWQFTLSASGANAEAIRLARHRTGRELIVVFGGHYHGHLDDTLVEGDEHAARPNLLGVNRARRRRHARRRLQRPRRARARARPRRRRGGDHRAGAHERRRRASG